DRKPVHAGIRRRKPPSRASRGCRRARAPGTPRNTNWKSCHDRTTTGWRRSESPESAAWRREFPASGEAAGRYAKPGKTSAVYVECLEAFALQAFSLGVSGLLVFERADLHAVEVIFLRHLDVGREMFFLQAAGD